MAHIVEMHLTNPATRVRELLTSIENLAVQPASTRVEELLEKLDHAEAMIADAQAQQVEMLPELARWENILQRLDSKPNLIASAARGIPGGLEALRAKHPPAASFWWHADTIQAQRTRASILKSARTLAIVVVALGLGYWLFTTLFPPDPHAVAVLQAISEVERQVDAQDWEQALAVAEARLLEIPGDPEVAMWVVVAAEQAGNQPRADEMRAQLQESLADNPLRFWSLLAERRLRAGDIEGGRAAAASAYALAPENAEILLLMGRVAVLANEREAALDYLDRAYNLALDTNPQIAVHARVLYSDLLQQMPLPDTTGAPETPVAPTQDTP